MKVVKNLIFAKPIRTLKRAGSQTVAEIEEAKRQLADAGVGILPAVLELLRSSAARPHALEVLGRLVSDESLPDFMKALASGDNIVAGGVIEVLSASTSYDASPLVDLLGSTGPERVRAERVLDAYKGRLSQRKLLSVFEDRSTEARFVVFRLLERHGDATMVPPLLRCLSEGDNWTKVHALKLMRRFPGESTVAGVRAALADSSRTVRLEAIQVLEETGAKSAIPDLCRMLRDPDLKVHSAAIEALTRIGDLSAVPYLVEVLKDESEYARRGAVEVLNEVATTDAIKDLVLALRDEDWWVRVRAADALGSLGGSRVVEALLGLLDNEDDFIRRYAVEILATVHDARAVEPLIRRLQDEDWWVRERSIDVLGQIGDARAVEPLIDVMMIDERAASICARALGTIGDPRAVEPLCSLARAQDSELVEAARSALKVFAGKNISAALRDRIRETLGPENLRETRRPSDRFFVRPRAAPPPDPGLAPPTPSDPTGSAPTSPIPRPPTASPPNGVTAPRVFDTVQQTSPPAVDLTRNAGGVSPAETQLNLDIARLETGTMLMARFRVVRRIGSGGFGTVYLVEDTTVRDQLILKILSPQISADESIIKRFMHELKYARRVTHKNVIRLFDFLEYEGMHAISMEYFQGQDLARLLTSAGRLPEARAINIAEQVCRGLCAAHEQGIIHRDIKPQNVLVANDDTVKIVDFGLASTVQSRSSQLTKSGILIGTPHYMAPEQIRGEKLDSRTDVYALGVLMYEMLAGKPPFEGDVAVNVLIQHLQTEATPLREVCDSVSIGMEQAVMRAMAKDRERRPTAAEFLETLTALSAPKNAEAADAES
jgi:serine/threonine-protein kinase